MIHISRSSFYIIVAVLGIIGIWVGWQWYNFSFRVGESAVYFLDVGQGDSEFISLEDTQGRHVRILIDGGRDARVVRELDRIIPQYDRYIDLIVLTHGDADHFKGLIDVIKEYRVGRFLWTGRTETASSFSDLLQVIELRGVDMITLSAGDRIRFSRYTLAVLSPRFEDINRVSSNESSLVLLLRDFHNSVLFTADIGHSTERVLARSGDIDVDVLKVAHHGSKNSSLPEFVEATSPIVSVIEVGKNSYGHPHENVLRRLASVGSTLFRTDTQGTIKIVLDSP